MKADFIVFTFKPSQPNRATIVIPIPFETEEHRVMLERGCEKIFGKADQVEVRRGVDLSSESDRRSLVFKR